MPLGKKQDPAAPFDPLARTVVEPGSYAESRYFRGRRAVRLAHAKRMAAHLQLTERGMIPEDQTKNGMGPKARDDYDDRLRDYPEMPAAVLATLEDIIIRYGLPLDQLDSDVAAFVLRRVLLDYRHMPLLQRESKPPLFAVEELVELLRVLGVNQHQLAAMLTPHDTPQKRYSVYVQIQRWVQGINRPQGLMALRVLGLIRQHVRGKQGLKVNATVEDESKLSQEPETVRRRRDLRRREAARAVVRPPLASAARRALEADDA